MRHGNRNGRMRCMLASATLVASLAAVRVAAAADPAIVELFAPSPAQRAVQRSADPAVKAATAVTVASGLRGATGLRVALPGAAAPLVLFRVSAIPRDGGIFSYHARSGDGAAQAVLVEHDGRVSGHISAGGREFRLETTPAGASTLLELDPAAIRNHPRAPRPPAAAMAPRITPSAALGAAADDGSVIDLLVVYSTDGLAATSDPAANAQLVVDDTNARYANSGIQTRLRLAGWSQTAYAGSRSLRTDLYAAQNPSDGKMDDLAAKRDQQKADLVQLIVGGSDDGFAGIAFIGPSNTYSYSVIGASYVTWAAAHEIGHNQGMLHNIENDPSGTYNHGLCDPAHLFHTTMSYYCKIGETVIPYFSTPDRTYGGVPIGNVERADNVRVLNENALTIANFRQGAPPPPPTGWSSLAGAPGSGPDVERAADGYHAFAKSMGSELLEWFSPDGDAWNPVRAIAAGVAGPPECLVQGGTIRCFFVNTSGHLAVSAKPNGSGWGAVADLGGSGLAGRPACIATSSTGIDCAVRSGGKVMVRRLATSWQAWKTAPAGVTAANQVTAVRRGAKSDLFAVNASGALYTTSFDGAGFTAWKKIGTGLAEAPDCMLSSGRLDCFGRTTGSSLWKGDFDGTAWKAATNLGGSIASRPAVVRTGTGFSVFAVTAGARLAERDRVGSIWQAWRDLQGSLAALRPSCLLDQPTGRLDCFAKGTNGTLQHLTRKGP